MKRFRHPIRAIREPFGTAGLIVAVVALILALTGAAFAATGLNGKQKKEVEKIAKKFAGKPGAIGAPGAPGAKGDAGSPGAAGTNGTNGTNGISVTTAAASEAECGKAGGVKVMSASAPTKVCNGITGFTKTLPSLEQETGTWSAAGAPVKEGWAFIVPISFPIPLAAGKEGSSFYFTKEKVENQEFGTSGCKWKLEAEDPLVKPESTVPGVFCVFAEREEAALLIPPSFGAPGEPFGGGYMPSGSYLTLTKESTAEPFPTNLAGTWAVKAP